MVELRDLFVDELLEDPGLDTLSGVLDPLSFSFAITRSACITGNLGVSLLRSLPLIVLDPKDVGRGGVDALDKFLALGATLGAAEEEGFALSSSVELSTECTTVSSAVESPTAGAATLLKVHVVSALDPEFIVVVEERLQLSFVAEPTADNVREGLGILDTV